MEIIEGGAKKKQLKKRSTFSTKKRTTSKKRSTTTSTKKKVVKSKTKKTNPWLVHVKKTMKLYPKKDFSDILKLAKKTYKK